MPSKHSLSVACGSSPNTWHICHNWVDAYLLWSLAICFSSTDEKWGRQLRLRQLSTNPSGPTCLRVCSPFHTCPNLTAGSYQSCTVIQIINHSITIMKQFSLFLNNKKNYNYKNQHLKFKKLFVLFTYHSLSLSFHR